MTAVNLWNQADIPHKGWIFLDVIDTETAEAICEMCGNERIRYVHMMAHADHSERLSVGCVCAEKMSDDYVNPRKRERELRNKTARLLRRKKRAAQIDKEKIETLQCARWHASQKGNLYLNVLIHNYACHLVVVKSKFGDFWAFGLNGKFSSYKYNSVDEAKKEARAAAMRDLTAGRVGA
jgi:hypothetical protein